MKKRLHIIILSVVFAIIIWTSVNLSGSYYTTLQFPIRVENIHEGYGIASKLPEVVTIKLKAVGWKILGLHVRSRVDYVVSAGLETGNIKVNLLNSVTDNYWVSSEVQVLDIWPASLDIRIAKLENKIVPVKPNVSIGFKEEFGLAKPVISEPESIDVSGTAKFLDTLKFIETQPVKFEKIDQSFTTEIELSKNTALLLKPGKVKLYFDVQKIVEREITDIPIKLKNVPSDRNVVLLPDRIKISLRGGINILGKINPDEIEAVLNYTDVINDTLGSVSPRIKIPGNTILLFKSPERIKYIIKKF